MVHLFDTVKCWEMFISILSNILKAHFDGLDLAMHTPNSSGVACAEKLHHLGHLPTVFDTGKRGVGGRMATRRFPDLGVDFDHACQFFTQGWVIEWREEINLDEDGV